MVSALKTYYAFTERAVILSGLDRTRLTPKLYDAAMDVLIHDFVAYGTSGFAEIGLPFCPADFGWRSDNWCLARAVSDGYLRQVPHAEVVLRGLMSVAC